MDSIEDRPVASDDAFDLFDRMDHGGVVTAAEMIADLGQGQVGQFPAQIHRYLPAED